MLYRWVVTLSLVAAGFGCRSVATDGPSRPTGTQEITTSLNSPLQRFEFEEPQMGVPFRIVLYATNGAAASNACASAFARIAQLNSVLSDYDLESELSRLSRSSGQGRTLPLSHDLWMILEQAQMFARKSGGAFDVTVGPMVNLWRKARRDQALPSEARLTTARQAVGYQKLQLNSAAHTAELTVPQMRLDSGGIAKGYAADEALNVLRTNGITRALVGAAGDIAVGEAPPGKPGWKIEVGSSDLTNAPPPLYVLLTNAALSTSGDLYQRLEINGTRYSHIVDPRTGIGLTNALLVTVIARHGLTADALATTLSVLGLEHGLRLLDEFPEAAARLLVPKGKTIGVTNTPLFQRFVTP